MAFGLRFDPPEFSFSAEILTSDVQDRLLASRRHEAEATASSLGDVENARADLLDFEVLVRAGSAES